jgi:hypothetical protein
MSANLLAFSGELVSADEGDCDCDCIFRQPHAPE